jgi:hypothetical protein
LQQALNTFMPRSFSMCSLRLRCRRTPTPHTTRRTPIPPLWYTRWILHAHMQVSVTGAVTPRHLFIEYEANRGQANAQFVFDISLSIVFIASGWSWMSAYYHPRPPLSFQMSAPPSTVTPLNFPLLNSSTICSIVTHSTPSCPLIHSMNLSCSNMTCGFPLTCG